MQKTANWFGSLSYACFNRPDWRRTATKTLLVMKLSFLLITAALVQVHAAGVAQSVSISGKDLSLKTVFREIKKQTGFHVLAKDDLFKNTNPVTVSVSNMPLADFLEVVLKDQPLKYEIESKSILLYHKPAAPSPQFDRTELEKKLNALPVTGTVYGPDGQPLAGVNVVVKGTKKGVTTNAEGKFSLEAIQGDALIISSIGFTTREVKIAEAGADIAVTLDRSSSPLDEVQIIAYGSTTERLNVGNVTTIRSADIDKQPVNNPLYALQGRVPGLLLTPTTGLAGGEVQLQIRGHNSLSAGSDPLIVVDGLPILNTVPGLGGPSLFNLSSLSFINPHDIESISVLKDADATSIYGSRGSSGVILITTKKGKLGKTTVDARVQNGWAEVPVKIDLINTQQYLELRHEAYANSGVDFINTFPYNVPQYKYDLAYDLFVWDSTRDTDWQRELLGGKAQYLDAQASISGGTSMFKYTFGGLYHRETTVFPGSDNADSRGGAHFSITGATQNQKLRAVLTVNYMVSHNVLPGVDFTGTALKLPPNAPSIYLPNGNLNWAPLPSGNQSWENPFSQLYNTYDATINNLVSSADISYKLFPFLTFKSQFGYNYLQGHSFKKLSTFAAMNPSDVNYALFTAASAFHTNRVRNVSFEPQLQYNGRVGNGELSALAGASIQNTATASEMVLAYGFTSDALLQNLASATDFFANNSSSQYRYAALFGRVNYNWQNKYIINVAGRRDGSSRFGPGNQFGNFGSVGAGWIFTEEPFMNGVGALSFGKLRVSYGSSGNDAIGDYGYMEKYEAIGGREPYQGARGYKTLGLFNEDYAWEVVRKMEVGLEAGFFNDRIFVNAGFFRNRSSNQLRGYPMPTFAGFGYMPINIPALIQNSGLEILLNTTNVKSKTFTWTTSINFTRNRNKLIDYPELETSGFSNSFKIGKPFAGYTLAFNYAGVDPATGRYQFRKKDGTITFDPQDNSDFDNGRYVEIYTDPKFYGGLSNTFTYKNFSVDVLLQFMKRFGYGPLSNYVYFAGGRVTNFPMAFLDRWRKPGDVANIQKVIGNYEEEYVQSSQFLEGSNYALQDVSFVRLKNLSVSYSLPASVRERLRVDDLRVFLLGQNLLMFSDYEGMDPETQSTGTLPPLRTITAGIEIRL